MAVFSEKYSVIDAKAFEILVQAHHRNMCVYARSMVNRSDVVDDLVQDAFITAYKNLNSFDTTRDFGKWVRGILRYKYLEWMRKKKEQPLDETLLEAIDAQYAMLEYSMRDSQSDLFDALKTCMNRLQGPALQVVELFYFDKKSCLAIADILESSDVAVRQRLKRVREILAKCILGYTGETLS